MTKEKFNPIAQLPILPGAPKPSDELKADIEADAVDATYPSIEPIDSDVKKRKIEIRLKPEEEFDEQKFDEQENTKLITVRILILVALVVLIFSGIFLTLTMVPKIATNMSNFSRSIGSLFNPKPTITSTTGKSNQAVGYIPLIPSTTAQMTATTSVTSAIPAIANSTSTVNEQNLITGKTATAFNVKLLSSYNIGTRNVVRFLIQNIDDQTSPAWSFIATLPSSYTPTYRSQIQKPLSPKSGTVFTLEFTANQSANLPIQISIVQ